ncbi:MAG: hypothetical protein JNK05_32085 [Myxococcales bacterium]|nr:hypothetical protein [Myxococcales bacterium]
MITGLVKLTVALIGAFASFGFWQWKKADARKRLREMDEGKRCVSCEKTETEVRDGVVRCALCGHTERLADVRAVQLTAGEIDAMTKPESPRSL